MSRDTCACAAAADCREDEGFSTACRWYTNVVSGEHEAAGRMGNYRFLKLLLSYLVLSRFKLSRFMSASLCHIAHLLERARVVVVGWGGERKSTC